MDRFNHWLEQFEARTLRERLLLLVAGLCILLFLGFQLGLAPQLEAHQGLRQKIDQAQQQTVEMAAQVAQLEAVLQKDPNRVSQQRLAQISQESSALDVQLHQQQQTLISPQKMPQVLEDVLNDLPLELISLQKLVPAVEIESDIEGVPNVYRHGLRLELEGSYRDTLDYLERLERLPWRFAWDALDIQMRRYPQATIILNLYTLSFDEVWLGV